MMDEWTVAPDALFYSFNLDRHVPADEVHSGYEDTMIAYGFQQGNLEAELKTRIAALGQDQSENISTIDSGYDASKAIIDLITRTQHDIPPRAIVEK